MVFTEVPKPPCFMIYKVFLKFNCHFLCCLLKIHFLLGCRGGMAQTGEIYVLSPVK